MRAEIAVRDGVAAVNFTASVTDVILLTGGEADRRLGRIREAGLPVHTGFVALENAPTAVPDTYLGRHRSNTAGAGVPVMVRGEVIDLPGAGAWTVNAAWRADALCEGTEVDVVAFLLDADERVVADEDFIFYNAPVSEHGAVSLSVDGDSEQSCGRSGRGTTTGSPSWPSGPASTSSGTEAHTDRVRAPSGLT